MRKMACEIKIKPKTKRTSKPTLKNMTSPYLTDFREAQAGQRRPESWTEREN
jgi:hypothetical protein